MDYEQLSSGLIKCVVSADELKSRGIDPANFLDRDDLIKILYTEILTHISKVFCPPDAEPFLLEASSSTDGLTLMISPGKKDEAPAPPEEDPKTDPLPDAPDTTDTSSSSVLLPIDELQATVVSDLISAAENGNIIEHLRKYLNEDFLDSLIRALSESGLENLINSFFAPPGADVAEADLTESMAKNAGDKEMAQRMEGYIEQLNAMSSAPVTKKSHRRICVMAEFKSLDDVEHATCVSHLEDFTGESWLFKTERQNFILVLASGKIPIADFRKIVAPLMNLFNAKETPEASLFSLLEHETPLIKTRAIEVLLGKV